MIETAILYASYGTCSVTTVREPFPLIDFDAGSVIEIFDGYHMYGLATDMSIVNSISICRN